MSNSYRKTKRVSEVLGFALPIWISIIVNSLLGVTDFFFLGKISKDYLTAVGIAYIPFTLISSLVVGIGIESNRHVSKNGNLNFLSVSIFSLIMACFLAGLSITFSDYIFFFVDDSLILYVKSYFNLTSLLIIPTVILYICTGILRGKGYPKKTIFFSLIAVILNFFLDYLFISINVLGDPLKGCGLASVISDFLVVGIYIFYLYKNKYISFEEMNLKVFIRNSFNYSLEKLFSASTIQVITSLFITKIDVLYSAIYFTLERFFTPISSFSHAYFEWIIYSKSKNYNSTKMIYIYYFILLIVFNLFLINYLSMNYISVIYAFIYTAYIFIFFIERTLIAHLFSQEKTKLVNYTVLSKNILVIVLLVTLTNSHKLSLISFGFANLTALVIQNLILSYFLVGIGKNKKKENRNNLEHTVD